VVVVHAGVSTELFIVQCISGLLLKKHNKHTIAKVGESINRHGGKNVTITK